jgi:hypothetical protein
MISLIQTNEGALIDGRAIPIALIGLFEFITSGGFGLLGDRGQTLFAQVWPSYLVLTVAGLPMLTLLMQNFVERRLLAQERDAVARLGRTVRIDPTEPTGTLPPILATERSAEKRDDDAGR